MWFAPPRSPRGKSSGFRVCYVDFAEFGFVFLVAIYTHNEKANLSGAEKRHPRPLVGKDRDGGP
jgi:hypothetical protein